MATVKGYLCLMVFTAISLSGCSQPTKNESTTPGRVNQPTDTNATSGTPTVLNVNISNTGSGRQTGSPSTQPTLAIDGATNATDDGTNGVNGFKGGYMVMAPVHIQVGNSAGPASASPTVNGTASPNSTTTATPTQTPKSGVTAQVPIAPGGQANASGGASAEGDVTTTTDIKQTLTSLKAAADKLTTALDALSKAQAAASQPAVPR